MWWWILTILFFLFSVGASTLVYFSLRRINQYEGLIIEFQKIIEFASTKMKQVDAKGHYEGCVSAEFISNFLVGFCFFCATTILLVFVFKDSI